MKGEQKPKPLCKSYSDRERGRQENQLQLQRIWGNFPFVDGCCGEIMKPK